MSKRPAPSPIDTPASAKSQRINRDLQSLLEGGTGGRSRTVLGPQEESHWNLEDEVASPQVSLTQSGSVAFIPKENETDGSERPSKEPNPTRSILENRILIDLIEKNSVCRFCKGDLQFTLDSTGVATYPRLTCSTGEECLLIDTQNQQPSTSFPKGKKKKAKLTEFALNVQYVLSFLSAGDGGQEAARVLGFLNLPNSTTMGSRSFAVIEQEMHAKIVEVAEKLVHRQVFLEVRAATEGTDFDYDEWEAAVNDPSREYPLEKYPRLTTPMDGAWNQRSAGRSYNSPSGFAILNGGKTRKPIAYSLRSTFCRKCSYFKSQHPNEPIPMHQCEINHVGSAGRMESAALLSMYHYLFDKYKVVLEAVVIDDDQQMRSKCRWSNADYEKHHGKPPLVVATKGKHKGELVTRSDKGVLRYPIPEPEFLADPAHRKKTFQNRLYAKKGNSRAKAKDNKIHEIDCIRLTRNFAYMSRQLKNTPEEKREAAGKAVVDHHFDIHDNCGDFCKRKKELAEGKVDTNKVYRSMERDPDLYKELCEILAEFITPQAIHEIAHEHDTNANESFNNLVAWIAPKNKVFAGSVSLLSRICIALGMKLDGFENFFRKLFSAMGMTMEPGTWHYLQWVGDWKERHLQRSQTSEFKVKRHEKTNAKIKEYVEQLRDARKDHDVYQTGVGMEGEAGETNVTQRKRVVTEQKPCACGSRTHQRTSHRDCPLNPKNGKKPWAIAWKEQLEAAKETEPITIPDVEPEEEEDGKMPAIIGDAEEQDLLDSLDIMDDSDDMEETIKLIKKADKEEDAKANLRGKKPLDVDE
jgi:hypothetical protein